MSIVEKALSKMQGARAAPGQAAPASTPGQTEPQLRVLTPAPARAPLQVDLEHLREQGVLAPEDSAARVTEEFRRIKWPLLVNAFGKNAARIDRGNLIMVASSVATEGKTFTSVNLALSIALERDCTVILADTDIAKMHLSDVFGIREQPGLTDLLASDSMMLQEVLMPTTIPGLQVLGAGHRHPHAPELLASKRMQQLTDELANQWRNTIVVWDSSPLLLTNEAQVLSHLVGQVVMVVRANHTPQPAVIEATTLLQRDKPINLVLNRSLSLLDDYYYGGYYEYGPRS